MDVPFSSLKTFLTRKGGKSPVNAKAKLECVGLFLGEKARVERKEEGSQEQKPSKEEEGGLALGSREIK